MTQHGKGMYKALQDNRAAISSYRALQNRVNRLREE